MKDIKLAAMLVFMLLGLALAWTSAIVGKDLPDGDWTAVYIIGCADICVLIALLIALRLIRKTKNG